MNNFGIIQVATATPQNIFIGNPKANIEEMVRLYNEVVENNKSKSIRILVYPELCVTGYTCGDLFNQKLLIDKAYEAIHYFVQETKLISNSNSPIVFIGAPIRKDNKLFNCSIAIFEGKILGFIPKSYMPNYGVFYEARYFTSAFDRLSDTIEFMGKEYPFTPNLLIEDITTEAVIGCDVCEDLWVPIPPSSYHALNGANIIVNLSASNEIVGKSEYRSDLVRMHSAQIMSGYIYASASQDESTTDNVFSSHSIISENGHIVSESKLIDRKEITYGEIDIEKCMNERTMTNTFVTREKSNYLKIKVKTDRTHEFKSFQKLPLNPFIPSNIDERTKEIMHLQAVGLAQRLKKIHSKTAVIGVSGGLDSTLALLVIVEAFRLNNYDLKGVIGVTMPCFGTTGRTLNNSKKLMDVLGITSLEISIKKSVEQHLSDIGHDMSITDITYENAQARERTQVLMDLANKYNGIVVGTGDLSELALGWCTYGGDQLSMFGVNASVPKTLIRGMVESYAKFSNVELKEILTDICNTPVSPELLPPNPDGTIAQITENTIGSYAVHDFIIYYMLRYGFSPKKIFNLYINNFKLDGIEITKQFEESIKNDFRIFYRRFFTQQFKRSVMPDGVRVGSVSLSPRGDWRMPSDASSSLWLDDLRNL